MQTSITESVRPAAFTSSRSPFPTVFPIMTADVEDMAITITFMYW